MTLRLSLAASGMLGLAAAAPAAADPLAAHRWRDRLLVVLAPAASDSLLAEQRRTLDAAGRAAEDRDLVVVEGIGPAEDAAALRRRFDVPPDAFRAILVGKDGGAKLVSDRPIAAERLFAEIDAMPMRRTERRERGR